MIALNTRTSRRFALIALGALALAACSDSDPVQPGGSRFSATYAFGASLDDTGNACNLSAANCTPAPYATPRVSNGPLFVELIAQNYGTTLTPSRTGGTNYAYAGARTGAIAGATQGVPNMNQQVDAYLTAVANKSDAKALFVVDAATVGNDINDALVRGAANPAIALGIVNDAVTNIVSQINKLYASGARNVLLLNSTDIGKTPLVRAQGATAMAAASQLSALFNSGLAAALPGIRSASAGLNLYVLDLGALTAEVQATPAATGFTNVTQACVNVAVLPPTVCTTPDTYFYWDGFHPTAATGRLVAQRAIAAIGN